MLNEIFCTFPSTDVIAGGTLTFGPPRDEYAKICAVGVHINRAAFVGGGASI